MAAKKVLCFGELLLRVSPAHNYHMGDGQPFLLFIGGAEANVATALSGWGVPVKYCTTLPCNFMAGHILDYLRLKGIDTSSVRYGGNRVGLYFLERGADLKGKMVYDRAGSSFSELKTGIIDWDKELHDVSWFNLTAISPALNNNVAAVCLEAVKAAARKNIAVSLDLNYRSHLWKYVETPIDVMTGLAKYCDVIMGNIWSANSLLGIPVDADIHQQASKQAYLNHAEKTSLAIMQMFPKCSTVANTFRFDSDGQYLRYYTSLYTGAKHYHSPEFSCAAVVDRSGKWRLFYGRPYLWVL